MTACVRKIRPDKTQLNTVTRPPAEKYAMAMEQNRLQELADLFDPPAEVIADFRGVHHIMEFRTGREENGFTWEKTDMVDEIRNRAGI